MFLQPPSANVAQGGPGAERGLTFTCGGDELVGILHPAAAPASTGVLVVVGGPQYRVGSHRQFVLLARWLAEAGIPVFRFDYRGMGDSSGDQRDFQGIGADIAAATNAFQAEVPGLRRIVVWGLCDAATAAAFYAPTDSRVCGLVLLNPWVRTDAGAAKAHLRHYYRRRVLEPGFWRKIASLRFDYGRSWRSLRDLATRSGLIGGAGRLDADLPLPQRFARALDAFGGSALIVLSGNDLTAAEFRDCVAGSAEWQAIVGRPSISWRDLPEADHTFSRRLWRDQVSRWTVDWVRARWPD